jgi:hypothetical protein
MKLILKYGLFLAISWLPMIGAAQLKDSSRTAIHLGILRNTVDPFSAGTISGERNVIERVSLIASIGINPVSRKDYIVPLWRFNWHISAEGRYFFALRRKFYMSGFFTGAFLAYDHKALYFRNTSQPYLRTYWTSLGPLIGYQHAFGSRLRASWGFTTTFYRKLYSEVFDEEGHLVGRSVWPFDYTFYTYLRIGITL